MVVQQPDQVPNNAYPRDVTSPGPYQRPGVAESQTVAADVTDKAPESDKPVTESPPDPLT